MEQIDYLNMIRDTYSRLHSLVHEQMELLCQDRYAEFLAVASRIHGIQEHLSALNKKFQKGLSKGQDKSKMEDLKTQILTLQKRIEQIYDEMERLIAQKKKILRAELARLRKGQKAVREYSSCHKISPRFVKKVT